MQSDDPKREEPNIECPIPENYDIDDKTPLDKKYITTYKTRTTAEPRVSGIIFLNIELTKIQNVLLVTAIGFQPFHVY